MTIVTTSSSRLLLVKSTGYALVAVVWILAAFSLVVGFIATQFEDMQSLSFNREQRHLEALDQLAIESTLLYLAGTRTYSYAGLRTDPYDSPELSETELLSTDFFAAAGDEIRMDGRSYRVRGGHVIRVQDAGSLVSLRSDRLVQLRNLLDSYVQSPARVEQLISTLQDYTDRDDIVRIDGAERQDYEKRQLLPPTNRYLSSPFQLYNVAGWKEFLDATPGFFDEVTIYVADFDNYNTMTPRAIAARGNMDGGEVTRIIEHRERSSFGRWSEVLELSGAVLTRDPLTTTLVPSRYLRVRLSGPGSDHEKWIGITLTPDSSVAPWEIDYRHIRKKEEASDVVAELAAPTSLLR